LAAGSRRTETRRRSAMFLSNLFFIFIAQFFTLFFDLIRSALGLK
jgi:hypothetical protein